MIAPYPRSVQPSLPTLVGLFVAFVTGGYGVGTFFGKLLAWLFGRDPAKWSDLGGITCGLLGLGLYLGIVIGIVLS